MSRAQSHSTHPHRCLRAFDRWKRLAQSVQPCTPAHDIVHPFGAASLTIDINSILRETCRVPASMLQPTTLLVLGCSLAAAQNPSWGATYTGDVSHWSSTLHPTGVLICMHDTCCAVQGTYYGYQAGAGHCSFQFSNSFTLPWTTGVYTGVAVNAPQYADSSPCGACIAFQGTGPGSGELAVGTVAILLL